MGRINYLQEIKIRFDELRKEVGDYKPEAFEYLEKRFYEIYEHATFNYFFKKDLKEGKNPVKEWLRVNYYPINKTEKKLLELIMLLTEDSSERFIDLMKKYIFKYANSQVFKKHCDRLNNQGFNPFHIWTNKNNFKPVFKEDVM